MSAAEPLVSIGLPVRNGGSRVRDVVQSVLSQDRPDIELVICDNASTDNTGQICRDLARTDERIVYHRQDTDVGLLNNFIAAMQLSRGTYFRWIGDGDALHPSYVSRCLETFRRDERRVLVTTQIGYVAPDGAMSSATYRGTALASPDPLVRFTEMLRLLNDSYLLIDPLYGMMRRNTVAALPRVNSYREDQLLAARLALAGPWGHVPEMLAWRQRQPQTGSQVAHKLGLPAWHVRMSTALLCRDLLRHLRDADLDAADRRRARAAVARFYLRRHQRVAGRRLRRLAGYPERSATPAGEPGVPARR
jgi:glycosyltransferase involved in cell wall biosynthesis